MARKKILIVDDEAAIRRMLRALLSEELYEFSEAADGREAQLMMDEKVFDMVISDVIMPDCDGIELVLAVRKKLPDIKLIIMSGGGRVRAAHYLDLAAKLGAARVFEKPFDAAALRQAVRELLT